MGARFHLGGAPPDIVAHMIRVVFVSGIRGNQFPVIISLRRHPGKLDLAAWFDGEITGDVGAHVARCARCRRRTAELARVRAWLRPAEPSAAWPADRAVKGP